MITVYDLSKDIEYCYSDYDTTGDVTVFIENRINALISCYMINTGYASQLNNPTIRDHIRHSVLLGKYSAGIGDYAVLIR